MAPCRLLPRSSRTARRCAPSGWPPASIGWGSRRPRCSRPRGRSWCAAAPRVGTGHGLHVSQPGPLDRPSGGPRLGAGAGGRRPRLPCGGPAAAVVHPGPGRPRRPLRHRRPLRRAPPRSGGGRHRTARRRVDRSGGARRQRAGRPGRRAPGRHRVVRQEQQHPHRGPGQLVRPGSVITGTPSGPQGALGDGRRCSAMRRPRPVPDGSDRGAGRGGRAAAWPGWSGRGRVPDDRVALGDRSTGATSWRSAAAARTERSARRAGVEGTSARTRPDSARSAPPASGRVARRACGLAPRPVAGRGSACSLSSRRPTTSS
jgi:hypothetical protein